MRGVKVSPGFQGHQQPRVALAQVWDPGDHTPQLIAPPQLKTFICFGLSFPSWKHESSVTLLPAPHSLRTEKTLKPKFTPGEALPTPDGRVALGKSQLSLSHTPRRWNQAWAFPAVSLGVCRPDSLHTTRLAGPARGHEARYEQRPALPGAPAGLTVNSERLPDKRLTCSVFLIPVRDPCPSCEGPCARWDSPGETPSAPAEFVTS